MNKLIEYDDLIEDKESDIVKIQTRDKTFYFPSYLLFKNKFMKNLYIKEVKDNGIYININSEILDIILDFLTYDTIVVDPKKIDLNALYNCFDLFGLNWKKVTIKKDYSVDPVKIDRFMANIYSNIVVRILPNVTTMIYLKYFLLIPFTLLLYNYVLEQTVRYVYMSVPHAIKMQDHELYANIKTNLYFAISALCAIGIMHKIVIIDKYILKALLIINLILNLPHNVVFTQDLSSYTFTSMATFIVFISNILCLESK